MVDLQNIQASVATVGGVISTLRGLFGLLKEAKELLPEKDQKAAETAIDQSIKQIEIAEAQLAQALGYPLCRCKFPPTIMLNVGIMTRPEVRPVYECSVCHSNTAYPQPFQRSDQLA